MRVVIMETNKLLNVIAGSAGLASIAMPTIGVSKEELLYWMSGILTVENKTYPLFEDMHPDEVGLIPLTIVAAVMITAGAVMFFLSMLPKLKMPLFTMLGWIIGLAGCGVFLIFGFGGDVDGPILLWPTVYPIGLIASFGSGGLGLVSWILQIRK